MEALRNRYRAPFSVVRAPPRTGHAAGRAAVAHLRPASAEYRVRGDLGQVPVGEHVTHHLTLLRINVSPADDGVILIAVTGDLDLATAPLIGDTFHRINSAQPLHVHLDLSGVNFCDAAGLSAFLAADRLLRATSGRLNLIRPSPQIRRLLTITKLDEILAIA